MAGRANAVESAWMGRVAAVGCVMCMIQGITQSGRTTVHHIKEGTGIGERSQHYLTVALCEEHHQGANGIHGLGTKGFYLRYRVDEIDLLSLTIERVFSAMRNELARR